MNSSNGNCTDSMSTLATLIGVGVKGGGGGGVIWGGWVKGGGGGDGGAL